MYRIFHSFRTALPISSLLLTVAGTAHANMYSGPVNKADWADNVPSYIDMYIAVPDNMPESPPIIVNIHSCGNNAGGQWSYAGFEALRTAIDSTGYIMIIPQQSRNCWNVGATESLTHGGGGDTGAIVQMVQYVIETYNADPTRVYAMGGSGGGMAVQALLAVYPEVFKAGHARAGVPAGCWAEGYVDTDQWSGACAGGTVDKTPEEWGNYVRAINPDFNGPRPRLQINQGDQDATISYNNTREAIDQWTNVLELTTEPTRSDTNHTGTATITNGTATYDRRFWDDACGYTVFEAWTALGQGHSMGYESVDILRFFGLDEVREQDPWDEQCGGTSTGGAGGAGAGGAGGAGVSAAGMSAGGMGAAGVGMGGTSMGGMGTVVAPTAGVGMGGTAPMATAGAPTSTGAGMTSTGAGMTSTGVVATAGAAGTITGVPMGSAGTASAGAGAPAGVVADSTLPPATGSGCSVASERVGGRATGGAVVTFVFFALGLVLGRRRHTHST